MVCAAMAVVLWAQGAAAGTVAPAGEVPPSVRLRRGLVPPAENAGLVERLLDADRDAEPAQRAGSVRGRGASRGRGERLRTQCQNLPRPSARSVPSAVPPEAGPTRLEPAPAREQEIRKYFTLRTAV